jgi:uncharacterized protein involved in exopolysaccharide biosynthesis
MSANSISDKTSDGQWPEPQSDEIEIARYLNALRESWLWILLITLAAVALTGAGVLFYRQFTPPAYAATATAAIVRTSSEVSLDARFTTTADERGLDTNTRRAALVALVKSGSIAQQVIGDMGDHLPPDLRDPATLLSTVSADMATADGRTGQSDLIQISVQAGSPQLAADIANAWANAYIQQVNSIYGQVPDDMLGTVEAHLVEAQAAYDKAQANLESFLTTSQLEALTRQSEVVSQTLSILQMGKVNALNAYMDSLVSSYGNIVQTYVTAQADNQTLAFSKEQEGQRARVAAYLDAYNAAQVDTFAQQNDRYRSELRMYYDQWLRTNSLLTAARTLQGQVAGSASGDTLASSALALQVLSLQMVNAAATTPPQASTDYLTLGQPELQEEDRQRTKTEQQPTPLQPTQTTPLQIQLDGRAATPINAADLRKQVDATVTSLEGQLVALQQNISQLNQSLLGGDSFQQLNAAVPAGSALVQAIADAYPVLFQTGVFSSTALHVSSDALFATGLAQAAQFLAQAESDSLPTANSPDAPMAATISQLEEQLRTLQSQIEIERSRSQQFTQQRDIAWESVKALSNKQAELQLARAAANSEVRLSGPAVPLNTPVARGSLLRSLILAALIGLLFGITFAFLRALMRPNPAQV